MTERIEVNPGEYFFINPNSMLATEYEAVFADMIKIGYDRHELGYMVSFTGRINNTGEHTTYTIVMSPQDGWALLGLMLEQYEWLSKQVRGNKNDA